MNKLTTTHKLFWVAVLAANLVHTAVAAEGAAVDPPAAAPWLATFTVLVLSFGLAATAGYLLDAAWKSREKTTPGVDVYIDQLVAGNGTRLTRLPETHQR